MTKYNLPHIRIKTHKEKINSIEIERIELELSNVDERIQVLVNDTLIDNDCLYYTADDLVFKIYAPTRQQYLEIVRLYDRIYGMCWRIREKHKKYEEIRRILK